MKFYFSCLFFLLSITLIAQESKTIKATRITNAPKIDGVLDDDVWSSLPKYGNFNMLDAQAGILGDLFGASDPNLAGVTDYKSLLNNLQVDPELRAQLMTRYQIHRLSLDPTKEDSLKNMATRMLEKAKQQSLEDPDRN